MIDMTAADEIADDARARSNVVRLAAAQALTGANSAVIFATGSIIGATLAPDMSLATVPLSMYVVGLAVGTLPTGAISRAYGRRRVRRRVRPPARAVDDGYLAALFVRLLFRGAGDGGADRDGHSRRRRCAETRTGRYSRRPSAVRNRAATAVYRRRHLRHRLL